MSELGKALRDGFPAVRSSAGPLDVSSSPSELFGRSRVLARGAEVAAVSDQGQRDGGQFLAQLVEDDGQSPPPPTRTLQVAWVTLLSVAHPGVPDGGACPTLIPHATQLVSCQPPPSLASISPALLALPCGSDITNNKQISKPPAHIDVTSIQREIKAERSRTSCRPHSTDFSAEY